MPSARHGHLDIYYELTGAGPPVVLLHSFLCSSTMWAGQVETLAREHVVINVDARGHGRSSPAHTPFSLYDLVGDVAAVLDDAGIERCVWAGLSMGGMTALRAALRVPDRVTGLILLDTTAGRDSALTRLKYALLGAAARVAGLRPLAPQAAREMFGVTARHRQAALVEQWKESFVQIDVVSALQTLEALIHRDDLVPHLPRITVPAAVLVGGEDSALPPRVARQLAKGLPIATYEEIPETGHLSALERPEALTEAMLRFLRAHGPVADQAPRNKTMGSS